MLAISCPPVHAAAAVPPSDTFTKRTAGLRQRRGGNGSKHSEWGRGRCSPCSGQPSPGCGAGEHSAEARVCGCGGGRRMGRLRAQCGVQVAGRHDLPVHQAALTAADSAARSDPRPLHAANAPALPKVQPARMCRGYGGGAAMRFAMGGLAKGQMKLEGCCLEPASALSLIAVESNCS